MPIPRFFNERCLILSDGGLESAVVAAIAAEHTGRTDAEPSMVLASWWGAVTDLDLVLPSIDRAVSKQSEMYGQQLIAEMTGYPPEQSEDAQTATPGSMQTLLLLQAAACAASAGIRKIIWPIRIGGALHDFDPATDIDALATTIDRAVLAGRLATLDAGASGGLDGDAEEMAHEMTIETPLIDFSNAQLADLAGDLSVSLDSCWWFHDRQVLASAEIEYQYWTKLSVLQSQAHGAAIEIKSATADELLGREMTR